MPLGGAHLRGEQTALLQCLEQKVMTTPEVDSLIETLRDSKLVSSPDSEEGANYREVARIHKRLKAIPPALIEELARTQSRAHHAWAEAWVEVLGWLGFDPANGLCPTDRYIRLACGLDSSSAAPIRGTRRGGVEEVLDVVVEVQQQSAQQ